MKILLGDFNVKWGREDIFKPKIGNESLHQDNNDNGVRIVNFSTSKPYLLRAWCSPTKTIVSTPGNIRKYSWTSPVGKTYSQTDQILIDRRLHLSIIDIRSFRGVDCDTDHSLLVAEVRERLAVSKQAAQRFDGERFHLRKLNELEVRKQYQIEITNRFAALENLNDGMDINRAWENIKENIRTSAKESLGLHELKQHLP